MGLPKYTYCYYYYTLSVITHTIAALTSNEDIKGIGVSWVVITRHGVERTHSQRIAIQNEKVGAIPKNNKGSYAIKLIK